MVLDRRRALQRIVHFHKETIILHPVVSSEEASRSTIEDFTLLSFSFFGEIK